MQLLIAANGMDASLTELLRTFKFRNEVKVLSDLSADGSAEVMAAAYAFVYPVFIESFSASPLEAMQCEVPVVTGNTVATPSVCGEAALYANPADFKDIAEKMMLVFKDENKAKELVIAGKARVKLYQWDKTADLLWQAVLKCAN